MMVSAARLQHIADELAAEMHMPTCANVRVITNEPAWLFGPIDEFQPDSGMGGYARETDELVLRDSFMRDADPETGYLAIRHMMGARQYRMTRMNKIADFAVRTIVDGLIQVVATQSGTPDEPARGSAVNPFEHQAVYAGDRLCWGSPSRPIRERLVGLIQGRQNRGASERIDMLALSV